MAQVGGKGIGLLRRSWNEIPEIVGSTFMALLGVGMGIAGLVIYEAKDGEVKRFKLDYDVIRPDDPRAKRAKISQTEP